MIARAAHAIAFPARFLLVGAANPCPCGFDGDPSGRCRCSAADIARYRSRLSGPLADRIDLHVRVGAARERQRLRYLVLPGVRCNAEAPGRWLQSHAALSEPARELLGTAAEKLRLSARAYHRTLRVARTVADLAGDEQVDPGALAEALMFRPAVDAP